MVGKAATIRYEAIMNESSRREKNYSRISYLSVLKGNVEVDTDENTLLLEIKISNREFLGERH